MSSERGTHESSVSVGHELRVPGIVLALFVLSCAITVPPLFFEADGVSAGERLLDFAPPFSTAVTWGLTGTVVLMSLSLAFLQAYTQLGVRLRKHPRRRRAVRGAVAAAALAYFVWDVLRAPQYAAFSPIYTLLGPAQPRFEGIFLAARWMGALGVSATVAVVACSWALAAGAFACSTADLRERWRTLESLLTLSSVGLASGVIATNARLTIQVDPELSGVARDAALEVVRAGTAAYGGLYTLILFVALLPTARVLRQAGLRTIERESPEATPAERREKLSEAGLEAGFLKRLGGTLALLSPLISSALSPALVEALSQVGG